MQMRSIPAVFLAAAVASGCARAGGNVQSAAIEGVPRSLTLRAEPALTARVDAKGDEALSIAEKTALDFSRSDTPAPFRAGDVAGKVTVSAPFRVAGRTCRRFTTSLAVADGPRVVEGTACRSGQGWSVIL